MPRSSYVDRREHPHHAYDKNQSEFTLPNHSRITESIPDKKNSKMSAIKVRFLTHQPYIQGNVLQGLSLPLEGTSIVLVVQ